MHLAVDRINYTLPRTVWCETYPLLRLAFDAIASWNSMRPGLFKPVRDPAEADVWVRSGASTWVHMPVNGAASVLYWGESDKGREYWFAHELGHTLGLGDHVWPDFPGLEKYLNPHIDRIDDPNRYRGVMSYLSPPAEWFGRDDHEGIRRLFPLPARAVMAQVASDGEG